MIRPAVPADVPTLVALVRELADYERAPDAAVLDEAAPHRALFGPVPAVFAHVAVDGGGKVVGFAVWFLNFATWLGRHGIYLEDHFVRPAARGQGHAHALLAELARIAVDRGYGRLEWWVLDRWETPSDSPHRFYRSIGAQPQDAWTVWRLEGDPIAALAEGQSEPYDGPGPDLVHDGR